MPHPPMPAPRTVALNREWLSLLDDDPPLRLYLSILRMPHPTPSALIESGWPAPMLETALPVLERRGMVTRGADGRLAPVPPAQALPHYINGLEQRARATGAATKALAEIYRTTHADADTGGGYELDVRMLHTALDVENARTQTLQIAERSQSVAVAGPRTAGAAMPRPETIFGAHITASDGIARRVIFDGSVLGLTGATDALHNLTLQGVNVRLCTYVPFTLVVVDSTVALLDTTAIDPSGIGSMIVRQSQLVSAVEGVADLLYDQAAPLPLLPALPSRGSKRAKTREAHILALMAAGASDSVIAKQVRVSQRTVERHIRKILDDLGASTRFQAGVQASRRGWL